MSRKDVRGALVTCRVMTSLHWSGGAVGSDPGPMQQSFPEGETSDGDWWGTNQSSSWQQWNSSSWDSRPQSWQQQSWYAGDWYSDPWYWHRSWDPWQWDRQRNYGDATQPEQPPMEEPEENDQQSMAQESRRPSKETAATRASMGASEADDGLASVEGNENTARGVKTGKDYIPEFDGRSAMREYERRVRLFEANTSIHPTFRAGKLIERLTDQAWLATEMLDIKTLKTNDGVDKLLQHLWSELEPLEFLRVFQTLDDFYKGFKRTTGQQFTEYDSEFRRQCQRLDEVGAGITGVTRAYWFLEKGSLGPDLRKQVVAAAGGCYDYPKLRAALVAIVPNVRREETRNLGNSNPRTFRPSGKKDTAHKVNVVEGDPMEEPDSENA